MLFLYTTQEAASAAAPARASSSGAAAGGAFAGSSRVRLALLQLPLRVADLFGVKVFTRPSFSQVKETVLGVEVEDRQGDSKSLSPATLQFTQGGVLSSSWGIAPLGLPAAASSHQLTLLTSVLHPQESLTMYFRVSNLSAAAAGSGAGASSHSSSGSESSALSAAITSPSHSQMSLSATAARRSTCTTVAVVSVQGPCRSCRLSCFRSPTRALAGPACPSTCRLRRWVCCGWRRSF